MDKAEFRATYPGLYDEARAEGFAESQQLARTHARLAKATGAYSIAVTAIANADPIEDTIQDYRRQAGASDEASARFVSELKLLHLESGPSTQATSPAAHATTPAAHARSSAGTLLDTFAADLDRSPTTAPAQHATAPAFGTRGRDLMALMESDLQPKATAAE